MKIGDVVVFKADPNFIGKVVSVWQDRCQVVWGDDKTDDKTHAYVYEQEELELELATVPLIALEDA